MSEFSVSYAGLEEAYSQLASIAQRIGGISSDLHQSASKVGGIHSLANKGYGDKIVSCARNANTTVERINRQTTTLSEVGNAYSRTEKKALTTLSDKASMKNGFSSESASIVKGSLAAHESADFTPSLSEAFKDSVVGPAHGAINLIDEFRYWRSTQGKEWLDKWMDEHSIKSPVLDQLIKEVNKHFNRFDDFSHAILNPTNPDALKKGAEAVIGAFGLGEVVTLYNRYSKIDDAVQSRAMRELEKGHKGKYAAQMIIGGTLTFGQMAVDSAVTGGRMILDWATGGLYSKATAPIRKPLHKTFAGWGEALRKAVDRI